jgi:hypothetical protein
MHRVVAFALVALALSAIASPAPAAWPHDPRINLPATLLPSVGQYLDLGALPQAVSDGQGGIICVWGDFAGFATRDIRAQRIDASGNRLWGPAGVVLLTGSTGSQYFFVVTPDGSGGAIVAWEDPRNGNPDIFAQRVNAAGTVLWGANGVAVCTASGPQTNVRLDSDGAGGAWIGWVDQRSGANDIYLRRVISSGVPQGVADGIAACTAAGSQVEPRLVAASGQPGCFMVWRDARTDAGDIYGQRFDGSGVAQWTANGVAICNATGVQSAAALSRDGGDGILVAWIDTRSGGPDIYAQRVLFGGGGWWTPNGNPVCTAGNSQQDPAITLDGNGGAVVAYTDLRSGSFDIYAQRISAETGTAAWGTDGIAVCAEFGVQRSPQVVADGTGGTYLAWYDQRLNSNGDIYAQRLSVYGSQQWPAAGVAVSAGPEYEFAHTLVSAGPEGCIVQAAHSGGPIGDRVTAQKVDRWGYLGAEPTLVSVTDVPNDQGGRVKVSWLASPLDPDPLFAVIVDYIVFRSVPTAAAQEALAEGRVTGSVADAAPAAPGSRPRLLRVTAHDGVESYWESVATQTAQHLDSYRAVVATTGDSVAGSNPLTEFMVQARGWNGWWNSGTVAGYSVDDLAPVTPAPFEGTYTGGSTLLSWGANAEPDLAHYRLYRGPLGFSPSPANRVAEPTATTFTDAAGGPFVYKLTAVDAHGNESPPATLIPDGTVDVSGPTAAVDFLGAPAPNPARTGAGIRLRFGLARPGHVELALHDVQGRRVASLVDAELAAGEHSARSPAVDLAPGVYLVRLSASGYQATRRLLVVR